MNKKLCTKSKCPAWNDKHQICGAGLDWVRELVREDDSVVYCRIVGEFELVRTDVIDDNFDIKVNYQEVNR